MIAKQLSYLNDVKNAIREAIVTKGVPIGLVEPFMEYALKILNIDSGSAGSRVVGNDISNFEFITNPWWPEFKEEIQMIIDTIYSETADISYFKTPNNSIPNLVINHSFVYTGAGNGLIETCSIDTTDAKQVIACVVIRHDNINGFSFSEGWKEVSRVSERASGAAYYHSLFVLVKTVTSSNESIEVTSDYEGSSHIQLFATSVEIEIIEEYRYSVNNQSSSIITLSPTHIKDDISNAMLWTLSVTNAGANLSWITSPSDITYYDGGNTAIATRLPVWIDTGYGGIKRTFRGSTTASNVIELLGFRIKEVKNA